MCIRDRSTWDAHLHFKSLLNWMNMHMSDRRLLVREEDEFLVSLEFMTPEQKEIAISEWKQTTKNQNHKLPLDYKDVSAQYEYIEKYGTQVPNSREAGDL
eukprot:TRINITY_DN5539_c0_g1_i1.p2 TRINITY_DN5539_c0_g1~~TRINITY_DN5539_c0_g1_i1.p2  ORF type:complete len:100 (+),score=21.43 TRINITY_DN5539_c0_g1_i1:56-355(+)